MLLTNTESMLFIDDHETEVFKAEIPSEQAGGPNQDVHITVGGVSKYASALLG